MTEALAGRTPPAIETARLRLRAHAIGDVEACVAMWADPGVVRHIGGKPSAPVETYRRVLGYAGHWALLGFGYWLLEEKATGLYAGEIGFADFRREIEPAMRGVPEAGWALAPHAQGRGLATEALRAVTAWGDAAFAGGRTVCMIQPANVASLRVAERCGYAVFGEGDVGGSRVRFLERRPE